MKRETMYRVARLETRHAHTIGRNSLIEATLTPEPSAEFGSSVPLTYVVFQRENAPDIGDPVRVTMEWGDGAL